MSLKYLSLEEILRLHFQVIEDFGGSHGVRDEGRLKSVVDAPRQEAFGQAQYPTIYTKAAVYLRNIIGDQPFSDGNKRTALTVCVIFLERNNKKLTASPKDLENFTVKVATDRLSVSEIALWLESHTG
jgi:death-on-curing protein